MAQTVNRVVTFGEIMVRMAPPGVQRIQQSLPGKLDVTFAGAEANVAASLALLGNDVEFVTALPEGPLTDTCLGNLRSVGIGTRHVQISDHGRFGIFLVETGANQRPTRVFYDRDYSSISLAGPGSFDWDTVLAGSSWLHLTGITPALSASAAALTLQAATRARELGIGVALDCNFRSKLWRWDSSRTPLQLASETLSRFLPTLTLLFGNEEDYRLLGFECGNAAGETHHDRSVRFAKEVHRRYPNIRYFATTFREQVSATHNNWSGLLYEADLDRVSMAPQRNGKVAPYEIRQIVDRVGSGDAFDAGILHGLTQPTFDPQYTIELATASSCLAHSIPGDWNYASLAEIEELMHGSGSGRVVR